MMNLMGTWSPFVLPVLVAVLLLALPGFALGAMLRLRGWWLAAAAAPLSVSLITVASVLAGAVGIRWSVLPVLGLTIVAVVAAWAWKRWVGAPAPSRPRVHRRRGDAWTTGIAIVVAVVPIAYIVCRGMGDPALIAQRYDNFFHINAIQFVLDTGNASPFWVGSMATPGLIYPSGWHAVASLIAQLSGSGAPIASNALVLAGAAFIWPLSAILLARTLFGRSRLVTLATGALCSASPAFPYLPLHYGPLYPLFLGLVLAPVAVAALMLLLRPQRQPRRQDLVLLFVLLMPGISIAHPGATMAVLALGLPAVVLLALWLWQRFPARRQRWGIVGGAVLLVVAGVGILKVVRPPASQIYWPVTGNLAKSVGEIVTASVYNYPIAPLLAILIALGVYVALKRPTYTRWIAVGMAFVGALLYVVVAGSPSQSLRLWLTGPWYNNTPRLASIWAISVIPLAGLGAGFVARLVLRGGRRLFAPATPRSSAGRFGVALLALFGVVLVLGAQGGALKQAAADVHFVYGAGEGTDGPILSAGEYELLDEVAKFVPSDAVIAGDPWRGVSFAYAISDRRVLMPHLLMYESQDAKLINEHFATQGDSPQMCEALKRTGVTYVLDFDGPAFMPNDGRFEGVEGLRGSPYAELVASQKDAHLYKITSCGLR